MSTIPRELKYTDQHEWLKLDGEIATVGITDYAQDALGDLVYVELPPAGKHVKAGEAFIVVESVKAASEVYAPVAGEVTAVNELLTKTPEVISSAPYGDGWMCKIKISDPAELEKLLSAQQYQKLIG